MVRLNRLYIDTEAGRARTRQKLFDLGKEMYRTEERNSKRALKDFLKKHKADLSEKIGSHRRFIVEMALVVIRKTELMAFNGMTLFAKWIWYVKIIGKFSRHIRALKEINI